MTVLCSLCKLKLDHDDAYKPYRTTEDYKAGRYPEWAYTEDLNEHLLDFHRLPSEFAKFYTVGSVIREFVRAHPEFEPALLLPGAITVTHNDDHPEPVEIEGKKKT